MTIPIDRALGIRSEKRRNRIVNGAMMISQENGSAAGTASGYYPVDQWWVLNGSGGSMSVAQVASVTPAGSPNRLRFTVTAADAAVAAADYVRIEQNIEGLFVADLNSGLPTAKTICIRFGVKAPAGTYSVVVKNASGNRSYVAEYTISAPEANTDVVKSVVIPLDQTGAWAKDNTLGLVVLWCLMAGTTFQLAAGAWGAMNAMGSPNQTNFMATNGNVFELFDVSLTEGSAPPPYVVPDYQEELARCQRYLFRFNASVWAAWGMIRSVNTACYLLTNVPVPMRTTPAITSSGTNLFVGDNTATPSYGGAAGSVGTTLITFSATHAALGANGDACMVNTASGFLQFSARM